MTADHRESDLQLMQRVASNDQTAVAELYDRFAPLVYRMAYQTLPTRAEADDAVQEVFVRLWRTSSRFDPKRASLVTWVMLLSRRHLVDRLRRARSRVKAGTFDDQWTGPSTEADHGDTERQERLAGLMERVESLPELQRTVVTRAYVAGHTLKQIREDLEVPLGTVKSALSRALARLRERINPEEFAA